MGSEAAGGRTITIVVRDARAAVSYRALHANRTSANAPSSEGQKKLNRGAPGRRLVGNGQIGSTIERMTPHLAKLIEEALKLPPEARAALAGSLLDSLLKEPDPDTEAAWEAEINRRVRELDEDSVKPVPWSEARRAILGAA